MFGFVSAKKSKHRKWYFDPDFKQWKIELFQCVSQFNVWAENYAYKQTFLLAQTDGRGEAKKKADTRQALQVKEGRPAHTQKAHTCKKSRHLLIFWFNFADTLDQIPDHCPVFFCVIDCQHIFDCRFFLFTFIKLSIYNQNWHSYFIGKAQLIPFREIIRNCTMAYWLRRKGIFLCR